MKGKKIIATVLTASLAVALCACSNSGKKQSLDKSGKGYDKIVYAYVTFNNIPDSGTLETVEEAINKITRDKIGTEVELLPIGIADYSSKVSLALQGGDRIDVFQSFGDFNTCVTSSMTYNLTDIIEKCAPETKELIGNDFLKTCIKNGKLYGIPCYKPYALAPMVIYKKEIADKLKIDMTKVKNIYDLTDALRKVKKEYPDMTPLVPFQQGNSGVGLCAKEVDYLSDSYFSAKGVLQGERTTVVNYYDTDEFKKLSKLVRTWYNEGLILKDAATTTSTSAELMASDKSFCFVASYSYPAEDAAASLQRQCGGRPLGAVNIGDAYLDTTSVNKITWMVASTSKDPKAALKFLNLTFTEKDIMNLLIYGMKDRDYVLSSDGFVSYPKGKDATSVPYTAQLSCATLGNFFLIYPMAGTKKECLAWEEQQNEKAKKSPALGFTFDSGGVKTEYTAVSNVIQQYLPGLLCGSVDPDVTLTKFKNKLAAAGLGAIIKEKQAQLDEWLKSK